MACELLAWMQMLALDGFARRWEPKRLRLRLFAAAGRRAGGAGRLRLRIAATWPWAIQTTDGITRLQALAPPPLTNQTCPRHQERRPTSPWNPPPPARQPGCQAPPCAEISDRPQPQPATSRSRNIKAKAR